MTSQTLICGDARAVLKGMPEGSVHMVVTSVPYFGLRNYGEEPQVWGGEPDCEHQWASGQHYRGGGQPGEKERWQHKGKGPSGHPRITSDFCERCDAWRGCLGLEPTLELYVEHIVEVFREVRRVLRKDGTLWLNCGFSYDGKGNLVDQPGAIKAALVADGWYCKSLIPWLKPAPMPESVRKRPTCAHEVIWLMSPHPNTGYFYDADAVREPHYMGLNSHEGQSRKGYVCPGRDAGRIGMARSPDLFNPAGRNLRNWWVMNTQPFPGEYCRACRTFYPKGWRGMQKHVEERPDGKQDIKGICPKCGSWQDWVGHFATFPEELPRRAILAGTSEKGCCPDCGASWERVTETSYRSHDGRKRPARAQRLAESADAQSGIGYRPSVLLTRESQTLGWRPGCSCGREPQACTVLDPFVGSGTTLIVAKKLGRNGIGIDPQPDYIEMARQRLAKVQEALGLQ